MFYFVNFPQVNYDNFQAINILARNIFIKNLKQNITNFFKYTIPDGERADVTAFKNYGDSSYDWLIFLINDITDPYYDWPLGEEQFDLMITDRYGTVANAQSTIVYYETNWYNDDSTLTIAGYQALLPNQMKYWAPYIAPGNKILYYQRSTQDIILSASTTPPSSEAVYYSAIDAYTMETNNNNNKKTILLLNSSYVTQVEALFQQTLAGKVNI